MTSPAMTDEAARVTMLAVAIAWIAGATDAIGFLETGGYFLSFMSGDSTRLGVGLAVSDRTLARTAGSIVLLFVIGVTAGTLLGTKLARARGCILLIVQATLLGFAALQFGIGRTGVGIACAVLAMALANCVIAQGEGTVVTYVTGALVRLGRGLAAAIAGGPTLGWVPHLLLWLGLAAGAATGAAVEQRWGPAALWLPAGASLLVALCIWPRRGYGAGARGPGDRRRP